MPEFGKYSILSLIGTGGMAEVFLAKSYGAEGLEKRLVLKRILPDYAKRSKFVGMFIDEAKVAVSLNHPNIVQVYEFGKVATDYYLAMEFVDGTDLGRVLSVFRRRDERMSIGEVAYVAIEVAKALDYAHRKHDEYGRPLSIVHRDVSPQNILLTWDGTVKLVDFGIAKARVTGQERSGVVKGKVSYMAPEQASGKRVDGRSDIFSLGAVMYEMITGRPPFPRGKPEDVLTLVRSCVIPEISTLREDVPLPLRSIIDRALSRAADDRYQTARELQIALTKFLFSVGEIHDAGSLADILQGNRDEFKKTVHQAGKRSVTVTKVTATSVATEDTGGTLRETADGSRESAFPRVGTPASMMVRSFRERRETIIVSGELLGISELRGQLTDDRWRSVLFDYIHLIQSVGYKNHCAVDRVDEGGFLLLAGIPISSENDAETAVHVATDLIEAMDAMSVNLVQPLSLSIGIGLGALVLERNVEENDERYAWFPDEPNWDTPKLLAKSAMAREILVDEVTQRRTRFVYEFAQLEDTDLAGKLQVFRVERPKTLRQRLLERRKRFTTLHGRDLELQLLRQSYRQAKRKNIVKTVIFLGDPGVGKASIVEEFIGELRPAGNTVFRATGSPELVEKPFVPIMGLLEELLQIVNITDIRAKKRQIEASVEALMEKYDELERTYILHAIALLFNIKYPENLLDSLDSQRRRARMFLSLRRLIGAASQKGAAVIVVNDIHWADHSTLEFFSDMVSEKRKRPMLVVLTARPNPDVVTGRFWAKLTGGDNVLVHQVDDLQPRAARALIADLLDHPMDRQLVERIVEGSGGNPLFIKEILEALQEQNNLCLTDGRWRLTHEAEQLEIPATVEGIVAGRIGSLPSGPKLVLLRASLIGRDLGKDALEAVFGEIPENDLTELVSRGFLKKDDSVEGQPTYRITKRLTCEVAAKALVAEERAEIHLRLADAMIEKGTDLSRLQLIHVAKHLEAAGETEDGGQYFLLAAAKARETSGLEEALTLAERALRLLDEESEFRYSALELKATLIKDLGHSEARRTVLAQLKEYVDRQGPPELQVQVLIQMAGYDLDMGQVESAEKTLREALSRAEEIGDLVGRGAAWGKLSGALHDMGREREAWKACLKALEIYESLDEPEGAAAAWNMRGILHHHRGELEEALHAYRRVAELSDQASLRSFHEIAQINIGYCLVKMGQLERAMQTYRQVLREILQIGHRRNESALLANLGHVQVLLGDFSRAEHTLRRCIRLSKRSADPARLADGWLTLATAYLARGRIDEAEKALDYGTKAALDCQNNYLTCHSYIIASELKLLRGRANDVDGALGDADRVFEITGTDGHLFARARADSLRAQCLARKGEGEEAVAISQRAVGLLSEDTIEGATEILYQHAKLLAELERDQEAQDPIGRAYGIFSRIRDGIEDDTVRNRYSNLKSNKRVVALWKRLLGDEKTVKED